MEAVPSSAVGDLRGRVPARDRSGSQHRAREPGPGRQDGVLVDVGHDHRADGLGDPGAGHPHGRRGIAAAAGGGSISSTRPAAPLTSSTRRRSGSGTGRGGRVRSARWSSSPPWCSATSACGCSPSARCTYLALSWVLSTGIVFHVVFGTLLFSGLTFIGPKDAMAVVVRYIVSVLVCRVILMYEIAGMRERYIETTRGQAMGLRSSPAAKHRSLARECLFSPYC